VFCVFFYLLLFGCLYHAIDCLKRLVSDMTCYVSSGTLNPTQSHTHPAYYIRCIGGISVFGCPSGCRPFVCEHFLCCNISLFSECIFTKLATNIHYASEQNNIRVRRRR